MKKKTKKRRIRYYLLLTLLIIGLVAWYKYSQYQYFINTPVNQTDITTSIFTIKKGETVNQIAEKLQQKQLIQDKSSFIWYTKINGLDKNIKTGRFILTKSLTIPEVVEKITNNETITLQVTIPEGSTIQDIDEELVKLKLITTGDFISATINFNKYNKYNFLDKTKFKKLKYPLEGYLFPDTYFIDPTNFYSENLLQLMLDNFNNKICKNPDLKSACTNTKEPSTHEIITMASIVEKEVRTTKDIPIVAGILWKRLKNNWMIGADATLLYLKEDRTIDYKDLQKESPYNTRINTGLPPGPICNPGIKSIEATINPQKSEYWFYLTTLDTGEVIYAKTNAAHNANKAKYLN